MTNSYKIIAQSAPGADSDTTLYEVPANTETIISTLFVANRGSTAATFRVALRPNGNTLADSHYIAYDVRIGEYDTAIISAGITLSAGDIVTVRANSANISFNLSGTEIQ